MKGPCTPGRQHTCTSGLKSNTHYRAWLLSIYPKELARIADDSRKKHPMTAYGMFLHCRSMLCASLSAKDEVKQTVPDFHSDRSTICRHAACRKHGCEPNSGSSAAAFKGDTARGLDGKMTSTVSVILCQLASVSKLIKENKHGKIDDLGYFCIDRWIT